MLISKKVLFGCKFKSIVINLKKYLTRVWYKFYFGLFSIKFCACEAAFPSKKLVLYLQESMAKSGCRCVIVSVVFVFADRNTAGYKHQISSKESLSSIN